MPSSQPGLPRPLIPHHKVPCKQMFDVYILFCYQDFCWTIHQLQVPTPYFFILPYKTFSSLHLFFFSLCWSLSTNNLLFLCVSFSPSLHQHISHFLFYIIEAFPLLPTHSHTAFSHPFYCALCICSGSTFSDLFPIISLFCSHQYFFLSSYSQTISIFCPFTQSFPVCCSFHLLPKLTFFFVHSPYISDSVLTIQFIVFSQSTLFISSCNMPCILCPTFMPHKGSTVTTLAAVPLLADPSLTNEFSVWMLSAFQTCAPFPKSVFCLCSPSGFFPHLSFSVTPFFH